MNERLPEFPFFVPPFLTVGWSLLGEQAQPGGTGRELCAPASLFGS
jgi:hypothetical protein